MIIMVMRMLVMAIRRGKSWARLRRKCSLSVRRNFTADLSNALHLGDEALTDVFRQMQNSNLLEEETLARQRNDLENEKKKIQKEKQILADREHKIYLAKQSANILKNQSQAAEAQSFKVLEGQRLALRQARSHN
eukprot:851762-Amorphochlora_amoeboformis.AAC.1